jgi:hypothetical protein
MAVQPDRPGLDTLGVPEKLGGIPEKSGPEKYAPPDRRPTANPNTINEAAVNAVEGEMRDFIRRDAFRAGTEAERLPDPSKDNLNSLIRRVSKASIDEIDQVIRDLEGIRKILLSEGERVSGEVAAYVDISRAAKAAVKVITDGLTQWKNPPDK